MNTPVQPNAPRAAFATTGPARAEQAQTLSADGSTGSGLAYAWDLGDGNTTTGRQISHVYTAAGRYSVSLTVTDTTGQQSSVAKTLTIWPAMPVPPVAAFSRTGALHAGEEQVLDGVQSTGTALTYAWQFGDFTDGEDASASHTYARSGSYTITLTVTDYAGQVSRAQRSFYLAPPLPAPPIAAFSIAADPIVGQPVIFDASASIGDGLIYAWDYGDHNTGTGRVPAHAYASAGRATARLTVTDSAGQSDTVGHYVKVAAAPPNSPTAVFARPVPIQAGQTETFDASLSSGDGLTYAWQFGDRQKATGPTPAHVYARPGTYQTRLTVTDRHGQTAVADQTVPVLRDPIIQIARDSGADSLYYDPSVLASIIQSTIGGEYPGAVDLPVGRVRERFSHAAPLQQIGGYASRPMLRRDGEHIAIVGDGVDDALAMPSPVTDTFVLCAAWRLTTAEQTAGAGLIASDMRYQIDLVGGRIRLAYRLTPADALKTLDIAPADTAPHVLTLVASADGTQIRLDQAAVASTPDQIQTAARITLLANGDHSRFAHVALFGLALIAAELTDDQLDALETELADKAGVTL